ncbi:hypothetical protein [Brevibacterium luteolum]|uniref:hypothetical protein n=1 Tax=Brevibacterium luteolum TaxID=199591 RepID=UPI00223A719D|nr:hypothetical protein [Brevibacterium luteolum]MCT1829985.1 hypothetical protein [Brevibacterium luteolum]
MNQHDEYSHVARDPHRRDRFLMALPLIIAALISAPLLWLSLRFSFLLGQVIYYAVLLGSSAGRMLGLGVLSLLGVIGLIGVLVCLWRGFKQQAWKWRLSWAAGVLGCAALSAAPLTWALFGNTADLPL